MKQYVVGHYFVLFSAAWKHFIKNIWWKWAQIWQLSIYLKKKKRSIYNNHISLIKIKLYYPLQLNIASLIFFSAWMC